VPLSRAMASTLRLMYRPSSVIIGLHPASTVVSIPLIFRSRLSRLSSVDRCQAMSQNKQSSWRSWDVIPGAARVPYSVCILDRFAHILVKKSRKRKTVVATLRALSGSIRTIRRVFWSPISMFVRADPTQQRASISSLWEGQ